MDPKRSIRVFTPIFVCAFLYFPFQLEAKSKVKNPTELIIDVCEQIGSHKKMCIETLKANPQTASAKDIKSLANSALGMTKKLSTKTSDFFNNLAIKNSSPAIKQCAKYFSDTVGMLNLGGLEDGTASLDVHYAYDNARSCEIALSKANVHIGSIPPAIQNWKNMFTVAYAAVVAAENELSSL